MKTNSLKQYLVVIFTLVLALDMSGFVSAACTLGSVINPGDGAYAIGSDYAFTFNVTTGDTCGDDGIRFTGYYLYDANGDGDFTNDGSYTQFGEISPAANSLSYSIDWDTTLRVDNLSTKYKARVIPSVGSSITTSWTFGIDNTAPYTTDNVPATWQTSNFNITFSCTDNVSGCYRVYYTTDNSTPTNASNFVNISDSWKKEISTDGNYTIKYRAADAAGNLEAVRTATNYALLDKVAPTVNAGTDKITNMTINQSATVSDATGGIATYAWTNLSGNITFNQSNIEDPEINASEDGNFTLQLNVTDNAGNSNTDTIQFVWDTIAPTTTGSVTAGTEGVYGGKNYTTDITYTITPADATSGVVYTSYCNDTTNACTPNLQYTSAFNLSFEGSNYVRFNSTDNAGNMQAVQSSNLIVIDKTAPTFTENDDVNITWDLNDTINVTVADAVSGVDQIIYKLISSSTCDGTTDFSGALTYTSKDNVSYFSESDDSKYVCFKANDTMGNIRYKSYGPLMIDNTSADIQIIDNAAGVYVIYDEIVFLINGTTSGFGNAEWTLTAPATACTDADYTGGNYTNGSVINITSASDDGKKVCLRARDYKDNLTNGAYSYYGSNTLKIDPTGPTFSYNDGVNTSWTNADDINVTIDYSVSGVGTNTNYTLVDTLEGCNSTTDFTGSPAYVSNDTITFNAEVQSGKYVCFRAQDATGHYTYNATGPLKIDLYNATTEIIVNASADYNGSQSIVFSVSYGPSGNNVTEWINISNETVCNASVDFSEATTYVSMAGITMNNENYDNQKICIRAIDNYAAQEGVDYIYNETAVLKIDTSPPTFVFNDDVSGAYNNSEVINITINAAVSGNSTPTDYVFIANTTVCNGSVDFTGSVDYYNATAVNISNEAQNGKILCLRATDVAGNVNYTSSGTILVDATGPTVSAGQTRYVNETWTTNSSAVDSLSGIASYQWTNLTGNITFGTATAGNTTVTAAEDGNFTIELNVTDNLGNVGTSTVTFVWDTFAPNVSIQYYSDSGFTTPLANDTIVNASTYYLWINVSETLSAAPTINISAEGTANDVSGVSVDSVGGNIYRYTRTIAHDDAAYGITPEDISFTMTDLAGNNFTNGNPLEEDNKTLIIDTVAPNVSVATLTYPNGSEVFASGDSINILWTAADIASEIHPNATPVMLYLYNGTGWANISTWIANTGSYSWTVPALDISDAYIRLYAKDEVGNIATDTSDNVFIIDSTAPTVETGSDELKNMTFEKTATVNASVAGVNRYNWTQLTGSGTITFSNSSALTTNITASLDGNYTIQLNVTDNAGRSTEDNFTLTWDTTVPAFEIQYYSDNALSVPVTDRNKTTGTLYLKITSNETLSGTPTISISAEGTANDVTDAATVLVSGNDYNYTRVISYDAAAIGADYEDISITAFDAAGNKVTNANPSDESTKVLKIDTVSPNITTATVTSPNGGEYWKGGSSHAITWNSSAIADTNLKATPITVSYYNSTAWVVIAIDEANDGSYTWNPIPSLDNDTIKVAIIANDTADNVANDTSDVAFIIDSTAPTVYAGADQTRNTMFAQQGLANDTLSGIASYYWSKDSGPGTVVFSAPTSNLTNISVTSGGTYVINFTVTDNAGNSDTDQFTLTWDYSTMSVVDSGPTGVDSDGNVTLTVTTDQNATCKYDTSDKSYTNMANTFAYTGTTQHLKNITGLSNGNYQYYVRCIDQSGNHEMSSSALIEFTVTLAGYSVDELATRIDSVNATLLNLSANVTTLEALVATTSSGVSTVNTTLFATMSNLDAVNSTVNTINSNVAAMNSTLNTAVANIASVNSSLQSTITDVAAVNSSLNTAISNIASVNSSLQSTITQVNNVNSTLEGLRTNVSTLETNVSTLRSDVNTLQTTATTLLTNVSTLQANVTELFSLVSGLANNDTSLLALLTAVNDSLNTERTRIDTLNSSLITQTGRIDTLNSSLITQTDRIDTLNSSLITQTSRIDTLNSTLTSAVSSLTTLSNKFDTYVSFTITDTTTTLQTSRIYNVTLTTSASSICTITDDLNHSINTTTSAGTSHLLEVTNGAIGWNNYLVSCIEQTYNFTKELTVMVDVALSGYTAEDLRAEIVNINATLMNLSSNVTTLESAITTTSTGLSSVNATLYATTNNLNAVNTTVNAINSNVAAMNSTLNTAVADIASVNSSLQSTISNVAAVNSTLNTAISNIASVNSSLQSTITQVNTVNSTLEGLITNVSTLETNVSTLRSDVNTLQTTATTLLTNVSTLQANVTTLFTLASGLAANDTALLTLISAVNTSLNTERSRVDTLNASLIVESSRIDTLNSSLITERARIDALNSSLITESTRIDTLNSSLITLQSSVTTLSTKIDAYLAFTITDLTTESQYSSSYTINISTSSNASCTITDVLNSSVTTTTSNGTSHTASITNGVTGLNVYEVVCTDATYSYKKTIYSYVNVMLFFKMDIPGTANGFTSQRPSFLLASYQLQGTSLSSYSVPTVLNASAGVTAQRLTTDDVNMVWGYNGTSWLSYNVTLGTGDLSTFSAGSGLGYYVLDLKTSAAGKSIRHN